MNIGITIAIAVIAIYIIVGPLVLFATYVFLDRLAQGHAPPQRGKHAQHKRDPALWGRQEVKTFLTHGRVPHSSGAKRR